MSITVITDPTVYFMGCMDTTGNVLPHTYETAPWNTAATFQSDHGFDVGNRSDAQQPQSFNELLIEAGGRLCYMSFDEKTQRPGGTPAYIKNILESGHGSVLEHAVFSFVFEGVSRTLTHELVRHRAGFAYSQLSQRYVDSKDVAFVLPHEYRDDGMSVDMWKASCQEALRVYTQLAERTHQRLLHEAWQPDQAKDVLTPAEWLKTQPQEFRTDLRKRARQSARSVLPGCTETKIAVTVNARALRHFLELRGTKHAEPEIRKLTNAILPVVKAHSPSIFGDYVTTALPDGTLAIDTPYRKV